MRMFGLFMGIVSISLRRGLAFRANFLAEGFVSIANTFASLAVIEVIFTATHMLGGWSRGEAIVLFGTYQMATGVLWTFIEPNLAWFRGQVTDGLLDDILLKPVPSIMLASLGACAPFGVVQILAGAIVLGFGIGELGQVPPMANGLAWLLLLSSAVVITWASRVLLASLAFWAPAMQPEVLYRAIWEFGRYPVNVYRRPVAFLLTWLLPLVLIATMPARALTRGADPVALLLSATVAACSVLAARHVWQAGLRRYTSATS